MSFKVMRLIWPIAMSATEKVVAVRLADFAGDDGGSIFPSINRVAADCNLSRRAVQFALRAFENEMRILVKVREASTGARRPAEYRFDLDRVGALGVPDRRTTYASEQDSLANTAHGTSEQDSRGLANTIRGTSEPGAPNPPYEQSEESITELPALALPADTPTRRATEIPTDWKLSDDQWQWSLDEGAERDLIRREEAKFRDHWPQQVGAKRRKADWAAAWRNWLRRALEQQAGKRPGNRGSGRGGNVAAVLELMLDVEEPQL